MSNSYKLLQKEQVPFLVKSMDAYGLDVIALLDQQKFPINTNMVSYKYGKDKMHRFHEFKETVFEKIAPALADTIREYGTVISNDLYSAFQEHLIRQQKRDYTTDEAIAFFRNSRTWPKHLATNKINYDRIQRLFRNADHPITITEVYSSSAYFMDMQTLMQFGEKYLLNMKRKKFKTGIMKEEPEFKINDIVIAAEDEPTYTALEARTYLQEHGIDFRIAKGVIGGTAIGNQEFKFTYKGEKTKVFSKDQLDSLLEHIKPLE